MCFLNFLYGYFILPESLAKENRREFDIKRANPVGAFMNLKKHPSLYGLLIALFLLFAMSIFWSIDMVKSLNSLPKFIGLVLGVGNAIHQA